MTLGLTLHVLGAIVWVGGMFFAYMVLRPVAGEMEGPVRLWLWRQVFGRFFPWVWASVLALLASGYLMLFWGLGGFAGAGMHVHIMQLLGWIMVLLCALAAFPACARRRRQSGGGIEPQPDPNDRRDQPDPRNSHLRDRCLGSLVGMMRRSAARLHERR